MAKSIIIDNCVDCPFATNAMRTRRYCSKLAIIILPKHKQGTKKVKTPIPSIPLRGFRVDCPIPDNKEKSLENEILEIENIEYYDATVDNRRFADAANRYKQMLIKFKKNTMN